ncbi:hypothetical protein T616_01041 [Mycobacterium tuberculosis UT0104]|nr:hypothetical protein T616_01041 [Mycobacterium tuberculosis UT0104]
MAGIAGVDRDPPGWPQHSHLLAGDPERFRHQLQRAETTNSIECFVAEWHHAGVAADMTRPWPTVVQGGAGQRRRRDVEPDRKTPVRWMSGQRLSEITWPTTDIEHSVGAAEVQRHRGAVPLGSGGDAAGKVEGGRTPQQFVQP